MSETPPEQNNESNQRKSNRPSNEPASGPSFLSKYFLIAALGVGAIVLLNPQDEHEDIPYSKFEQILVDGEIKELTIQGESLYAIKKDDTKIESIYNPDAVDIVEIIPEGTEYDFKKEDNSSGVLMSFLWIGLLLGGSYFILTRLMGNQAGKIGGMKKAPGKLLNEDDEEPVTFDDVEGIDDIRDDITEIVDYLQDPGKYEALGAEVPKGVLLIGPPGTGKTLTAKAVAGESGVPFYGMSGSDFVEMFVGVGAARVRDTFKQARENAPCIIFIDELDAMGRQRGSGLNNGHDEREQTLMAMLTEMDGFGDNSGIIIMAATNRPDVLDKAILRPGRFDRHITMGIPDLKGREAILKVHVRNKRLHNDVDLHAIAQSTAGFAGAELKNLANEAALITARRNESVTTMEHFEYALDRLLMGVERKSLIISPESKLKTAYHEIGHTLVGRYVEGNDPFVKVSVIPRDKSLGVTISAPMEDRTGYSETELKAKLAMFFGGYVAEKMIYDEVSTGASNDIERATEIATKMVKEWGMSKKMGTIRYAEKEQQGFLGYSMGQGGKSISEQTSREIDEEVKRIIDEARDVALTTLEEHKDELHTLSKALAESETLSAKEVNDIIGEPPTMQQSIMPMAYRLDSPPPPSIH